MLELDHFPILKHHLRTLKETSKDSSHPVAPVYMTDAELQAVDFDAVKDEYIRTMKLLDVPKSNDALFRDDRDGTLYFIEFKNGNIQKEIFNVKRKIFDSLLIFTDIIGKGISYTRQNVRYILVYNKENSKKYVTSLLKTLEKDEIQDAAGYEWFSSRVAGYAGRHLDIFGLAKQFEKLYFARVYTYSVEEFEKYFVMQQEQG